MRLASIPVLFLGASIAQAEVPQVSVDIAPVHSLVVQVMEGAGEPDLILRPDASPHHYALRPSEAAALSNADLVIWMGEGLTPWLEGAIGKLADEARSVELLDDAHTRLLALREGISFEHEVHDHGTDHDQDTDHDHDAHGNIDPHAWLDPGNAQRWMHLIAEELSVLDVQNAALYRENARLGIERLEALKREIEQELGAFDETRFMVFHDAFHYFEEAFELPAAAAVSLSDAARPGPARIAALRDLVAEQGIACLLTEPQFDPNLARAIFPDGTRTGVLDPMGSGLDPGSDHYAATLRALARGFAACNAP